MLFLSMHNLIILTMRLCAQCNSCPKRTESSEDLIYTNNHPPEQPNKVELELEFYLVDRQLHNIGEIIRKCEIILSGDSHKGTNWPLSLEPPIKLDT